MLASADSLGTIVMAIVAIAFLFGIGACVGAVVGRQAAQKTFAQLALAERKIPERVTRELVYCLELAEGVAREADRSLPRLARRPRYRARSRVPSINW